jgi:hypothetical protein
MLKRNSTTINMAKISRRSLIAAAAAQTALPLESAPLTVTAARSSLRLRRFGDPQRPTVALFLPHAQDPSVVIEMPEHAWRKAAPEGQQEWFYKMSSRDPDFRSQVEWVPSSPDLVGFTMTTPSGYVLRSLATLQADGLEIVHEVSHKSVLRHAAIEVVTCVKLYRPFTDVFLERTYVHHADGLELIASETKERMSKNAEEWLPCRYIARVGKNDRPGEYRVEKLDGITRYFKSKPADVAFLGTESTTGNWTAATFARGCDSVFTNPARTCHHVDPEGRGISNGQANLRLKVYLVKGTAQDAWRHVSATERV